MLLTLERDGSFILDVANDPQWLAQRIVNFPGPFADRIVLWVDGREIRPESDEYIQPPAPAPGELPALGTHRLRGRMPLDARTLRWYYGLVIDPYPLTIRRADGRIIVEEIGGDAWSGTIDLSGQFRTTWLTGSRAATALVLVVFLLPPIVWLSKSRR